MGEQQHGALADPATRAALARAAALAVAAFVAGVVLLVSGFTRLNGAERLQDDLVRDGTQVSGIVLEVGHPVPGVSKATFAYPVEGGREQRTMVVFNDYERGQKVTVFVRPSAPTEATLAGETPMTGAGWVIAVGSLVVGLVLVPVGGRRCVRAARAWSVVRANPWTPWTMVAVYPQRRRLAVVADGTEEERLVRVDRWSARTLGKLGRRSPVYLAGEGRWYVVSPTEGRRLVAVGRMDPQIERLSLVGAGAAPDRFDVAEDEEPPDEVF